MDIRFLSVEFLNTYLTAYRIFSDAVVLFDTLLQWYYAKAKFDYPKSNTDGHFEKPGRSTNIPLNYIGDYFYQMEYYLPILDQILLFSLLLL